MGQAATMREFVVMNVKMPRQMMLLWNVLKLEHVLRDRPRVGVRALDRLQLGAPCFGLSFSGSACTLLCVSLSKRERDCCDFVGVMPTFDLYSLCL